jgi:heme/copper-type cytochrome/quinol oxidase subunit 4
VSALSIAGRTVVAVWLVLMLGTAVSTWGFARASVSPAVSTIAVVAIAAIKVGLVMAYFMELRRAPLAWRLAGTIWVAATASAIVIVYLA